MHRHRRIVEELDGLITHTDTSSGFKVGYTQPLQIEVLAHQLSSSIMSEFSNQFPTVQKMLTDMGSSGEFQSVGSSRSRLGNLAGAGLSKGIGGLSKAGSLASKAGHMATDAAGASAIAAKASEKVNTIAHKAMEAALKAGSMATEASLKAGSAATHDIFNDTLKAGSALVGETLKGGLGVGAEDVEGLSIGPEECLAWVSAGSVLAEQIKGKIHTNAIAGFVIARLSVDMENPATLSCGNYGGSGKGRSSKPLADLKGLLSMGGSTLEDGCIVWIGGLPDEFDEVQGPPKLTSILTTKCGEVKSVTVRHKPHGPHGQLRSWTLVTFRSNLAAGSCLEAGDAGELVLRDGSGKMVPLDVKEGAVEAQLAKSNGGGLLAKTGLASWAGAAAASDLERDLPCAFQSH